MPNGFHGLKEEWQQLVKPFEEIDEILATVAKSRGMELTRNSRGWPERSLRWGAGIRRQFQVYLENEKTGKFRVGITAGKDGPEGRSWRGKVLREGIRWSALREELPALLEEGVRMLDGWSESDLVLARKPPRSWWKRAGD